MSREQALAGFVIGVPALGVAAALFIPPSKLELFLFGAGALATMIGVELGYHRCFAHRAFDAHPALAWLLGALGSSAFLGPVIWWAATHRRHHAHTDRPGDPHSPHWPYPGLRGLAHAHAGWLFRAAHIEMSISASEVKDLWKSPRTVSIQRSYLLWGALGLIAPTLVGLAAGRALGAFLWGGLIRLFVVSHVVWAVNSLGHSFGTRAQLSRSGQARNLAWLVLPSLGGGLHANHHDAPRAYTTRFTGWQLDLGGALVWWLAKLGLATGLKRSGLNKQEASE